MMFSSRYGSALLLALGMLSAHVADAYYYGGYRYYGGPAVVRRTVVVRGRRGRAVALSRDHGLVLADLAVVSLVFIEGLGV